MAKTAKNPLERKQLKAQAKLMNQARIKKYGTRY